MSDCNYCKYLRLKRAGCRKASGRQRKAVWDAGVKVEGLSDGMFGRGVVIVDKDGKFAAWFMTLPKQCCC